MFVNFDAVELDARRVLKTTHEKTYAAATSLRVKAKKMLKDIEDFECLVKEFYDAKEYFESVLDYYQ